jgi:hypothetical protein
MVFEAVAGIKGHGRIAFQRANAADQGQLFPEPAVPIGINEQYLRKERVTFGKGGNAPAQREQKEIRLRMALFQRMKRRVGEKVVADADGAEKEAAFHALFDGLCRYGYDFSVFFDVYGQTKLLVLLHYVGYRFFERRIRHIGNAQAR